MKEEWGSLGIERALITDRLKLRRFQESDIQWFYDYRSDERVRRYQGSLSGYNRDQAADFVREQMRQTPGIPGFWQQVALELTAEGRLIGDCGIHYLDSMPRQVELGITLVPEYQGRGYAREALTAVLDILLRELGVCRAVAFTDPRNERCMALLERLGMRRETYWAQHVQVEGVWMDDWQYAIWAEEWKNPPGGGD
ncbi:MAG TPA: GNAT family N-acetyltransferase [Patescibacteria group bacterium]|nr:GNAT family N-acetyltransferase [Patescibacteria group bacterium]